LASPALRVEIGIITELINHCINLITGLVWCWDDVLRLGCSCRRGGGAAADCQSVGLSVGLAVCCLKLKELQK